jgi:hypothetical protein
VTTYPRCPYCLDDLMPDQEMVRCAECRTPHHQPCFRENGGCVAFGCTGHEQVEGGLSIFAKPAIRIRHEPTHEVEFGPFLLGYRPLVAIPEKRLRDRCPEAYVRLTIELRELREGDVARGRGVVYTPEPARFKRLELALHQGIQRPVEVARIPLVPGAGPLGHHDLERGSHPFYLELRAPPAVPFLDPFQLELCLVRSMFQELRSMPLPVYLLQRRFQRREHRIRVQPRALPEPPCAGPEDPFGEAALAGAAPLSDPFGPDPFGPDPFGPNGAPGDGWQRLPVTAVGSLYDSGGPTGRSIEARFCASPGSPKERLKLDSPSRPPTSEFTVQVCGGAPLSALNVAIHYGLVKPGGGEVDAPGFPAIEEVRLLGGAGSLDCERYDEGTGIELRVSVPTERLEALAKARESVAHNAALRLNLALDGIDRGGRVLPPVSRTVTFTVP